MASDFIRDMIAADVESKKHNGKVCTRFPPEPNGYLHIGHAKSICLNFGVAKEFGGKCHLRMDDTNPATEDPEYVDAIQRDVKWLGFDWGDNLFYASGYYDKLYEIAERLIRNRRAYVCDLNEEQMSAYRGTLSEPGKNSPFRNRTVDQNLDLFRRMRAGEFKEGSCVLRAKIDMTSPNMKLRDPAIYRIKHAHHYRTGDAWCIYPLYDFAHCLSDSMEGITHSLCTMEFESARELYDWVIAAAEMPWVSRQTEFARLNLTYTVMSKRKLLELVEGKFVNGWDDPRMPTIAGLRRRGYTPEAIFEFCNRIGIAKNLSTVDLALLEFVVREDLNARSPRILAVHKPLKVVIDNYPDQIENLDAPYWPQDVPNEGSRTLPFSREVYIDADDFMEAPPKDFYRLAPGREVRLRHAYVIKCERVIKNAEGDVVELRCSYDPQTRGGVTADGRKVSGTIQWVSAAHALDVEVRLYDRLFVTERPGEERDFKEEMNPESLVVARMKVEPSLKNATANDRFQFERVGFFIADADSKPGAPVFNRTVALKDSWAKQTAKHVQSAPKTSKPKIEAKAAVATELSAEAQALKDCHGVSSEEARTMAIEPHILELFEAALASGGVAKTAAALVCNDVLGEVRARKLERAPFSGKELADLSQLIADGTLSSKQGKDVLAKMFDGEGGPKDIVKKLGISQVTDVAAIEAVVDRVLAANVDAVARFRAGNTNVLGALVGLAMKESGGKANPKTLNEVLRKKLA